MATDVAQCEHNNIKCYISAFSIILYKYRLKNEPYHTQSTYIFLPKSHLPQPPKPLCHLRHHPNHWRHCLDLTQLPKIAFLVASSSSCSNLLRFALCCSMYSTRMSHQLFSPSQIELSSLIPISLLGSNPTTRSLSLQICFSFILTLSFYLYLQLQQPKSKFKSQKKKKKM